MSNDDMQFETTLFSGLSLNEKKYNYSHRKLNPDNKINNDFDIMPKSQTRRLTESTLKNHLPHEKRKLSLNNIPLRKEMSSLSLQEKKYNTVRKKSVDVTPKREKIIEFDLHQQGK